MTWHSVFIAPIDIEFLFIAWQSKSSESFLEWALSGEPLGTDSREGSWINDIKYESAVCDDVALLMTPLAPSAVIPFPFTAQTGGGVAYVWPWLQLRTVPAHPEEYKKQTHTSRYFHSVIWKVVGAWKTYFFWCLSERMWFVKLLMLNKFKEKIRF